MVNGNNDSPAARNTKDVYVRISQRFNLERDAESRHAIRAAGPTGPRDHTSIRFGAFYYHGTNELNYGSARNTAFSGRFRSLSTGLAATSVSSIATWSSIGLGMVGHDDNHIVDTEAQTIAPAHAVTFTGGFAGANWWIFPWMVGTMRYDFVNSPTDFANGVSQYRTRNRFSPGFQILARANIKILGEYQYHWGEPYADTTGATQFFRPNTFVTGIDYVF